MGDRIQLLIPILYLIMSGCSTIESDVKSHVDNHDGTVSAHTKQLLEITATGMAEYSRVKALVEKGAKTEDVSLSSLYHNNDYDCRTVMYILKKNILLYKHKLNNKPKNPFINNVDNHYRKEDLALLADTGNGRTICTGAIQFLVQANPSLKNVQIKYDGSTVIHKYLEDTGHSDWKLDIAKLLMTQENVNTRRYDDGYTPIHVLLLININQKPELDTVLINEIISRGGNLDLKSNYYYDNGKKNGIKSRDLILKKYSKIKVE